ncbi:MAG: helix-turn-helix transcriptional regulator [Oscillospiraceae bacterium]|nr:helix-turn-helix transcriptional regulator [Oscillospiraceae bacterium]
MQIYFNEVFRRLRRDRDLTQEQAADIFGVSPQAVSRWETGAACPDIALLPNIAEYFGVTIEELLGADEERRRAKVQSYLDEFQRFVMNGDVNECIRIAREGVKEFPNNYALLDKLMYALFISGDDSGNIENWQENNEKYKDEIIEIGEKIIRGCTDDVIRYYAKSRLGFHYCELGEKEKGRAIFESLPSEDSSREVNMYWALEGEERMQHMRQRTYDYCSWLIQGIWRYAKHDIPDDERLVCLDLCEKIAAEIFESDDYGMWNWRFALYNVDDKAPALLRQGEAEKALVALETAIKYTYNYTALPEVSVHHSPLVRGVKYTKRQESVDTRTLQEILLDHMNYPCYKELSSDPRYIAVKEKLNK